MYFFSCSGVCSHCVCVFVSHISIDSHCVSRATWRWIISNSTCSFPQFCSVAFSFTFQLVHLLFALFSLSQWSVTLYLIMSRLLLDILGSQRIYLPRFTFKLNKYSDRINMHTHIHTQKAHISNEQFQSTLLTFILEINILMNWIIYFYLLHEYFIWFHCMYSFFTPSDFYLIGIVFGRLAPPIRRLLFLLFMFFSGHFLICSNFTMEFL